MTKIVPALLVKTAQEYHDKIRLVRQLTDRYQLDVIDPEYADNPTVDLGDIEPRLDLQCDVHIMSFRPQRYIESALRLRPHMVILQFEQAENIEACIASIKRRGTVKVGLAINPQTEVESVAHLFAELDHILIMAYSAGFAGQKLQPKTLKKVAHVRELAPNVEVGLDGGVSDETLARIARCHFDVVNVNSFLFQSDDVLGRYSKLLEELS